MSACARTTCCSDSPGDNPTPACYDASACGCQVVDHPQHPNPSMTGKTTDTPWVARIKAEALQEAAEMLLTAADYRGSDTHRVSLPVARRSIALWLKDRGERIQREAQR